ncbi:MAG: DUF5911 domain-containing protein, partial [Actinobacteria bacterium]|nr:DUF5911 domain-containing protein [Actinomycetota bacterium]
MTKSIAQYGLLGDTRTAALVSENGSIDWMCVPRFDAAPVFGRLIDAASGGSWSVQPDAEVVERAYRENTSTIETRWGSGGGSCLSVDGLVADATSSLRPSLLLVR